MLIMGKDIMNKNNPHPYADMICQQARTGQPVYIRHKGNVDINLYHREVTNTPNWNIPNAEYSFTQFED